MKDHRVDMQNEVKKTLENFIKKRLIKIKQQKEIIEYKQSLQNEGLQQFLGIDWVK